MGPGNRETGKLASIEKPVSKYDDERGSITNIVFDKLTSVAVIESKAGAERSNHYHPKGGHYLYVLSGKMIYMSGEINKGWTNTYLLETGEFIFTPPGLAHRTQFLEDTVLLSLTVGMKDRETYDANTVKVNNENIKM